MLKVVRQTNFQFQIDFVTVRGFDGGTSCFIVIKCILYSWTSAIWKGSVESFVIGSSHAKSTENFPLSLDFFYWIFGTDQVPHGKGEHQI